MQKISNVCRACHYNAQPYLHTKRMSHYSDFSFLSRRYPNLQILVKVSHELLHVPASLAASHAEAHARHGTTEVPVVASHNTGREGRLTPGLIVFLKTWKTYINVLYTEITKDECGMPL